MQRSLSFRPGPLTIGLVVWLVGEVGAFLFVVQRIGLGGAVLVGIATTFLGVAMLRRVGQGAITSLRRAVQGAEPSPGAMLDGSLAALGAVLLILPGFLSDLIGLALAAPSVRQWLAHRFGSVARPGRAALRPRPGMIELSPGDWRRVDEVEARRDHGGR
jgi:UPF0716 protein FxsA